MDRFNELFVEDIKNLKTYVEDPEAFMKELPDNTKFDTLERMEALGNLKLANSFELCVKRAKTLFYDYFCYSIRDILANYPLDHKNDNGGAFWSGAKRAPTEIEFGSDEFHAEFIEATAKLYARALGISTSDENVEQIIRLAN